MKLAAIIVAVVEMLTVAVVVAVLNAVEILVERQHKHQLQLYVNTVTVT